MPRISALFTNNGVPVTTPATAPTIRIRRQDTQALVVTDASMTEQGDGIFTYDFAESATLEYVFRCDGDPIGAGQTTALERYVGNSFSGITEARIETDVPAILVDTDTTIPALIDALNNIAVTDILADSTAFNGADVTRILDLLEATSEYDTSTDPWEEKWIRQSDATLLITFQLYDDALAAINNANPLTGSRVRRRLKV
jgi:hypothetical protein